MMPKCPAVLSLLLVLSPSAWASTPAELKAVGDWEVEVTMHQPNPLHATVRVAPPVLMTVSAERYQALPEFNPSAAGWIKGRQPRGVQAQECTTPGLLDPNSFSLRVGPEPEAPVFERAKDHELDPLWGTFGRATNGLIKPGQAVFASNELVCASLAATP
jgi:hypothetical protein